MNTVQIRGSCLTLVILITNFYSLAQFMVPSSAYENLKSEFEEEELVVYDWQRDFQFRFNPATGLMEVKENFQKDYLNVSGSGQNAVYPIFADDYSKIKSIKVDRYKHKPAPFPFEMNGIFHHDSKVHPVRIHVAEGATTAKLNFQKEYTDSKYFTRRFFGSEYPIRNFSLRLKFPANSEVEALLFNAENYGIERKDYKEGTNNVIEFTGKDLPAFESEEQSKGRAFYEPHIVVLTKSVTVNNEKRNLLSTTEDLYSWYSSLVKQIGNDDSKMRAFVDDLVKDCGNKDCEIETIFYWVQDNIRYIAFEDGIAGFKPEACQDVYYNKYGDCKGMANLMTEMLRYRDVDARLTWIGTQSVPYDYSIPSLAVDNHMICTVINEKGEYQFLDGTEKFITINDVAERIQGRPVMIEDGENFIIAEVPSFDHFRNEEVLEVVYQIEDDNLKGQMNYTVKGEGKVRMMNRYAAVATKDKDEANRLFFSRGITDIKINSGNYSELKERHQEIEWSAEFEAKNRVSKFGSELYLDWDIYKTYARSRIKEEEMEDLKGGLDFQSKVHDVERYRIEPIEGFELKNVPENFSIQEEHFILAVDFSKNEDGSVTIQKEITIPSAFIPNDKLMMWNESLLKLEKEVYDSPIIYEQQ